MPPEGTFSKGMKNVIAFFFFYLCLIVSPLYTTLFILCPFDIASCLSELCEEAGWLHAVTGTVSPGRVCWWVTLPVCACKHIAQVPTPLPFELLGRNTWSINCKNNVGSQVSCPNVEHNIQWHSGMSGSEAAQVHPVIGPGKWRQGHEALVWRQGNTLRHFNTSTQAGSLFFEGWVVLTSVHWAIFFPSWPSPAKPRTGLPPSAQRTQRLWWGSVPPQPRLLIKIPAKLSGRNILTQPLLWKLFFEQKFPMNSLRLTRGCAHRSASVLPHFKISATQINTCNYTMVVYTVASSLKTKNHTCTPRDTLSCISTHLEDFFITWHYPNTIKAL